MSESHPTHLLNVRVQKWTGQEYRQPGRIAPSDETWAQYRGTMEDCDAIAAANGAPELWAESPESRAIPFHDRTYLRLGEEGEAIAVWCRGRRLDLTGITEWVESLPIAGEVFRRDSESDG